jgi:hypothetical protein
MPLGVQLIIVEREVCDFSRWLAVDRDGSKRKIKERKFLGRERLMKEKKGKHISLFVVC